MYTNHVLGPKDTMPTKNEIISESVSSSAMSGPPSCKNVKKTSNAITNLVYLASYSDLE